MIIPKKNPNFSATQKRNLTTYKSDEIKLTTAIDYYYQKNYNKAMVYLEEVKAKFLSENKSLDKIPSINNYLQEIYWKLGNDSFKYKNYLSALQIYERLKGILESKNDQKSLTEVFEHLTLLHRLLFLEYNKKKKYMEAINHGQQYKELLKKLSRPINEVNSGLKDLYLVVANIYLNSGKFKHSIEYFEKTKELFVELDDTQGLLYIYPVLGELYFESSEVRKAVQYFIKLRDLADSKEDYSKMMYSVEHIGKCFQIMRDYKSALNNFKMLLQLAWKLKNIKMELVAYDYMSIQYFYLGDIEGAKYYNNRVWKGITEKFTSPTREISNKALEALKNRDHIPMAKVFNKFITIDGINIEIPENTIGLPSPRTSSGETDMQVLPAEVKKIPSEVTQNPKPGLLRSRSTYKQPRENSLNSTFEAKKYSETRKKIKPFILLSHLSPMESVKNFLYADQIK